MKRFQGAKNSRFPSEIKISSDLVKDDNELSTASRNLLLTNRGRIADQNSAHFGERLVYYNDASLVYYNDAFNRD